MGDISAEPSMEEILSSIKRIMAEEGEGPVRSRRPARPLSAASLAYDEDGDSVLELDDPIVPMPRIAPEPIAPPRPVTMTAAPMPTPRPAPVAEEADESPSVPPPAPRPVVAEPDPDPDVAEPIVSDHAATASRNAIDQLTRTLNAAAPTPAAAPTADASLEGLVREMLRPMLREWLDNRLPAIVEQQVATEIARITGGR